MSAQGHVLLVGSVPAKDAEAAMSVCARKLGALARRYPDGETGERINWIRWQRHVYDRNPAMELVDANGKIPGVKDSLARPFFRLRKGVDPKTNRFDALGFAAHAERSYRVFHRLRAQGLLSDHARFQVAIPTVMAILSGFVVLEDRAAVEPALEAAMKRDVETLVDLIPHENLAIQWDVAVELIGFDGGMALHFDHMLENSVARICRQVDYAPVGVEVGIHLCYGDPGHKHVIEPADSATCVAFSNAIIAAASRRIDWMHIPIPRGWMDGRFYEPLSRLKLSNATELYLGLVHLTDGIEGTRARIDLARRYVGEFGVSTECGFGRRDPETIGAVLDLHKQAAMAR
jgi:hypothetical protein